MYVAGPYASIIIDNFITLLILKPISKHLWLFLAVSKIYFQILIKQSNPLCHSNSYRNSTRMFHFYSSKKPSRVFINNSFLTVLRGPALLQSTVSIGRALARHRAARSISPFYSRIFRIRRNYYHPRLSDRSAVIFRSMLRLACAAYELSICN